MTEITEQELERIAALFVQTASGFCSDDGELLLYGISPSTLYVGELPQREVGHISSTRFVELWADGENGFAQAPPTAVLSFVGRRDDVPEDVVVVLREPQLAGGVLRYAVETLEGRLPDEAGPCTLFIDAIGQPLSPLSIAGARPRRRRELFRAAS